MDSRNAAVRSENNQISELKKPNIDDANMLDPPEEVVPLILSSGIRDVFCSIANYLDIKSFMKLAMASKEMYKRCMEDKRIRFEIQDGKLHVAKEDGVDTIDFKSSKVSVAHTAKYLAALPMLPCILHLKSVYLMNDSSVAELRRYLSQRNVKSINNMSIYDRRMMQWTELFSLVEDFRLDSLFISFFTELPAEHARTLLQLKISAIVVATFVNIDTLLELDAPIADITLRSHPDISINLFTDILWKIQTSALEKLNLRFDSFNWELFKQIPFATDIELPENRPLVFYEDGRYISDYEEEKIYKVLHLDGSVTKCVVVDGEMTITKCETSEFPPVLKSDEDVVNDMRKWLPKVSCSEEQFLHFANTLTLVDASDNGPLPDERPLFFFDSFKQYWMLCEDGSLKKYALSESLFSSMDYAICKLFDLKTTWPEKCGHASLAIYIIMTMLQNGLAKGSFSSYLKGEDILRCLSDFKTIPFDYWGPLPEERPLFFERDEEKGKEDGARVALLGNGEIVQCSWTVPSRIFRIMWSTASFSIERYHVHNVPPVLISKEIFKNMLGCSGVKISRMELDVFLGAFEGFKTLSFDFEDDLPEERPLVFKQAGGGELSEKRWFLKHRVVTTCEWTEGEASLTLENPREFPLNLTKELVKEHLKKEWRNESVIYFLDFDVFRSYFADFKMISYDSSILLPEDRPLIFEKTEVKEGCNRRDEEGRDLLWTVCLVDEDDLLVSITWGEKGPREVAFHGGTANENIPPLMKSAEYLKCLLERKCDSPGDKWKAIWYGDLADFLAYFEGYVSLPFEHEGPLPEDLPFVFYTKLDVSSIYFTVWFPRDDGTVVECSWCDYYLQIGFTTNIPSALRRRRA